MRRYEITELLGALKRLAGDTAEIGISAFIERESGWTDERRLLVRLHSIKESGFEGFISLLCERGLVWKLVERCEETYLMISNK